jgi:hypothetical protein
MNRQQMLTTARRPLVLATLSTICLAGLLAGGLVVAGAVAGSPSTEPDSNAGGNGDDNAAVALNTKDGSTVYDPAQGRPGRRGHRRRPERRRRRRLVQ